MSLAYFTLRTIGQLDLSGKVHATLAVGHTPSSQDKDAANLLAQRANVPPETVSIIDFETSTARRFDFILIPSEATSKLVEDVLALGVFLKHLATGHPSNALPSRPTEKALADFRPLRKFMKEGPPASTLSTRSGSYGTYLGNDEVLINMQWGASIICSSRERSRTPLLVATGTFEAPLVAYLARTLSPGDTAIDVGANIGLHTVLMASLVGQMGTVHAFEPFRQNLHFLRTNVEINWLTTQTHIHDYALSNVDGHVMMQASPQWDGLGSITQETLEITPGYPTPEVVQFEVATRRLDSFLSSDTIVDVIKIDVEGAENLVIEGFGNLLESGRIRRVIIECMPRNLGEQWPPLLRRLTTLNKQGWRFGIPDASGALIPVPLEVLKTGQEIRVLVMEQA